MLVQGSVEVNIVTMMVAKEEGLECHRTGEPLDVTEMSAKMERPF